MKHSTAAIVVTYNRADLLIECIQALKAQTYRDFDILVVNNGSTDHTEEILSPFVAEGTVSLYYNTGENLGGAGGFNYGLRKAYEAGYEYFWLMDDDTVPEPLALEALLHADRKLEGNYGFLASRALWTDGALCKMNIPLFEGEKIGWVGNSPESREPVPILTATFVSFFTTRKIVRIVGLPIKEFFLWADDTNYCLRISQIAGGYWVPESIVLHKMKSNQPVDIVTDSSDRMGRYTTAYRNRYYNRRMEKKLPRYYLHLVKTAGAVLLFSKDGKGKRLRSLLEGARQGQHFHPKVEYL